MSSKPTLVSGSRHSTHGLSDADLLRMYRFMVLARSIAEREWQLQRSGKTAFVVTGEGQEALQIGAVSAIRVGRDWLVPYYRDMAVAVAAGVSTLDIFLNSLARAGDASSGGRNLPSHFSSPAKRLVLAPTVVAAQIPHAAGVALASKLKGIDEVTLCFFGEGATSQGDFHEALNFAGIYRLPVVFICENNRYAISVPFAKQSPVPDLSIRAAGYGFPGVSIDGNDLLKVYATVKEAVDRARGGGGPTFIEGHTYRLGPHTSNDDPSRYRSREEEAEARTHEPIGRFRAYLIENGLLDEASDGALRQGVQNEVDEATRTAEASPLPNPEDALRHVYKES